MSDITMCANKKCHIQDTCYQYHAIPDRYQAYAIFEPKLTATESNGAACDSFWNCKGYKLRPTKEVDKQKTPFDKE